MTNIFFRFSGSSGFILVSPITTSENFEGCAVARMTVFPSKDILLANGSNDIAALEIYFLNNIPKITGTVTIMNILIAIGGRKYSKPTLDLGMKVSNSFEASTTIAYVGKKISQFSEKDVSIVHQNLDERQLYRPGVRTLEWAYNFLKSKEYIQEEKVTTFNDYLLIDEEQSRMRVLLKGKHSNKINLILRTGEIIEQLRSEVQDNDHVITIIGGGNNKGMQHDLVQFIDSSVLVVKNYSVKKQYKILLPVNNSKGSNKAIEIAEQFAKANKLSVEIVTVLENKSSDKRL